MKRILVTGSRAPAALELIRQLSRSGFIVYAGDCVKYPLSRPSKHLEEHFVLPSPRAELQEYTDELNLVIRNNKIDCLIPMCEEVFYISRIKNNLDNDCVILCDEFEKLSKLHNKFEFSKLIRGYDISVPKTKILTSKNDLSEIENMERIVLKPVFSRFAVYTLISPKKEKLSKIDISQNFPWIMQERIEGIEYCTYGMAMDGKLLAHSCYSPTFRVGIGSGFYFTPANNERILKFISDFVRDNNFTGQIGFDFIATENNEIFVLECNPRATSGIHCLPDNIDWHKLLCTNSDTVTSTSVEPKMIAWAMLTFGLKYLFSKEALRFVLAFFRGNDPVWNVKDIMPAFFQMVSILEIIQKSMRKNISILSAATEDIEWDGEII